MPRATFLAFLVGALGCAGIVGVVAMASACGAFGDAEDEPSADAAAGDATASSPSDSASDVDLDAGVNSDATDADGGPLACAVKAGLLCEDGGCPTRCPAGDGGPGSDLLELLSIDGGTMSFENRSDCHRYDCTRYPGVAEGCDASVGQQLRVCAATMSTCGPGTGFFVSSAVDCASSTGCAYSCAAVSDRATTN